jgi:fructuronate reductase
MKRLSLSTLAELPDAVRQSTFAPEALTCGILHLGIGAFHRAHQAVYTEDAIEVAGDGAVGGWGIVGVSMRQAQVAETLAAQDGLFTVETRDEQASYRVIGCVRRSLTLPKQPEAIAAWMADPGINIVTLTVTEKGYCLGPDGLDVTHPDIIHDITNPRHPRSAIGALVAGLRRRLQAAGAPLTVISCDNLTANGPRLAAATVELADHLDPALAHWIVNAIAFPETMVDSIVPASDQASRARTDAALGVVDLASVQRESFAQWVIEDRFAGPRPAWDRVGVEIVGAVQPYRQLKLHVLNAGHSALAYLGLARGHDYVRQAISDPELAGFLDSLVALEVAPGLANLPVAAYWSTTRKRFANPAVDHRLDQIAQDGAFKLAQRVFPLMISNRSKGLPVTRLGAIVRAWLAFAAQGLQEALADPTLFPDEFRSDPVLRASILGASA